MSDYINDMMSFCNVCGGVIYDGYEHEECRNLKNGLTKHYIFDSDITNCLNELSLEDCG